MANLSIKFYLDDARTIDHAAIVAGYTAIGGSFEYPAVEVLIQNFTDAVLSFSTDGITEKFKLHPMTYRELDIAANKQNGKSAAQAVGTIYYVKQIGVPLSGSADVCMCYLG